MSLLLPRVFARTPPSLSADVQPCECMLIEWVHSMFREPDEIAAEQAAAKLDQIAAAGRSTIRRESTVRPGRSSLSRSLIDRIRDSRRETGSDARSSQSRSHRDGLRDIHDLDTELERLRRQRQRQRATGARLDRDLARESNGDYVRPEPEPRSSTDAELLSRLRSDPGSATLLDEPNAALSFETLLPDSHETVSHHLPRPSRESGLRFEVGASDSDRLWPTRNSTHRARVSSPLPSWYHAGDHANENTYRPVGQMTPSRIPVDGPIDTPPTDGASSSYPALSRVNHSSPRPLHQSTTATDGLGDRVRSPSIGPEEPVEENWATLLNTMDSGRSSATTSFMSSRSDSRSRSNRSSQATTMTTSFGEIAADDSCDLDLPSGITEDDVREIRARHGRLRPSSTTHPARPEDIMHQALQGDSSRGNDRMLELEVFGVILERMQRREEIPDEWWAAVGLSPDVVRGNA